MKSILQPQLNHQRLELLANFTGRSWINSREHEVRLGKSIQHQRCCTNEIIVTLQRPQFANTSNEQTIGRQSEASQNLKSIERRERAIKTIDVNAIRNHRDLLVTQDPLCSQLTRDCG